MHWWTVKHTHTLPHTHNLHGPGSPLLPSTVATAPEQLWSERSVTGSLGRWAAPSLAAVSEQCTGQRMASPSAAFSTQGSGFSHHL